MSFMAMFPKVDVLDYSKILYDSRGQSKTFILGKNIYPMDFVFNEKILL
jgi:hypothetical protein